MSALSPKAHASFPRWFGGRILNDNGLRRVFGGGLGYSRRSRGAVLKGCEAAHHLELGLKAEALEIQKGSDIRYARS
jgi:hypothetical protein